MPYLSIAALTRVRRQSSALLLLSLLRKIQCTELQQTSNSNLYLGIHPTILGSALFIICKFLSYLYNGLCKLNNFVTWKG